jgi:hypothetical protein
MVATQMEVASSAFVYNYRAGLLVTGTEITVHGSNFGYSVAGTYGSGNLEIYVGEAKAPMALDTNVTDCVFLLPGLDGQPCVIQGEIVDHSSVRCILPPGRGLQVPVCVPPFFCLSLHHQFRFLAGVNSEGNRRLGHTGMAEL